VQGLNQLRHRVSPEPLHASTLFAVTFSSLAVTLRVTTFNVQKFYMVLSLRLCVLYGSQNKVAFALYSIKTD
jgi:hypothetical protein